MSRLRRIEFLLFLACFFAFAYFNQGGGWNQNARFAEIRAMVEEGRFAIDDFLVYRLNDTGSDLVREPLHDAEYAIGPKRFRLCWVDMEWNLSPVGDRPLGDGVEKAPMIEVCASGDIGYIPATGHFHPNKPPGTSFLALPGYFAIYHIEKACGIDPDHWLTIEVNAWLTSALSVGLVSALGCLLFFRLACDLSGGAVAASILATLSLAFGTTFFPFATLLFDHAATASLLVAAFYFIRVGARRQDRGGACFALAGLCAGLATITNYIAFLAIVLLGIYLLARARHSKARAAVLFVSGAIPPFLLICWYGWSCFGSPFRLSTQFQNPLFMDESGAFLGMFPIPHSFADIRNILSIAVVLLISPFRGLFFFAPVLLLSLYGCWRWLRNRDTLPEALLCLATFGLFFGVNAWFNGYHGGFAAGPRYLIPGIPFLALPLVSIFASAIPLRCIACALAGISIAINLLLTATDAQNPAGVGGHARVESRHGTEWNYNLITDYAWPLFARGRAWPLLREQIPIEIQKELVALKPEEYAPQTREQLIAQLHTALIDGIHRADPQPLPLGSLEGPVSVNPIGVYEGLFTYGLFPPKSPECRWASFNLGELLWAQSRWSLLPLLVISGALCAAALRLGRTKDK